MHTYGPLTGAMSGNTEYKIALGGTAESFLLKDEGGWYKGEDGGVWIRTTRKQAAAAGSGDGRYVPTDLKVGDFVRVRIVGAEVAPGFAPETVSAIPPYLVKRKAEVVIS